ncbi:unnamed protein product, partial [Penicillium nalgiovense]
ASKAPVELHPLAIDSTDTQLRNSATRIGRGWAPSGANRFGLAPSACHVIPSLLQPLPRTCQRTLHTSTPPHLTLLHTTIQFQPNDYVKA